jgi:RsiW-degrading membrane proteinase PrsW (M82 family)
MTDPTIPASPILPPLRAPRKWLGPAGGWLVFLAFTFLWFCNMLYNWLVLHHVSLSPNSLVLGGFGMAAAFIYTLAYRLRPNDGITVARLLITFLLGGLLSTQLAIFIESPLVSALGTSRQGDLVLHSLAGVIEEACKIVTVIILARGLTVRNARTGLFIGGAVGFGFAAFEDMRYAAESLTAFSVVPGHLGTVIFITYSRDLFGPFDHPIMTALLAAALFAATRNGRFRITPRVVLVYLAVSVVHGLIDASADLLAYTLPVAAAELLGLIVHIVLSLGLGTVWLIYSRGLRRRMLVEESTAANTVLTEPEPAPST